VPVLAGERPSVLVLGGGFAGVASAVRLARAGLAVTLVSERPSLFVYPTSIWVVTGEHSIEQDLIDLADLARQHGFRFVVGAVERLEPERRAAVVDGVELQADYLVLALGAGRAQLPGHEHTTTVWGTPADTEAIHARLAELIARGGGRIAVGFGGAPADPSAVRGGPAFEVMFNIDHLLRQRGLREHFELTFFAPMDRPGVRMGERAAEAVPRMLNARGVALRFGQRITGFDAEGVTFADGGRVDAELVVFIPGGVGNELVGRTELPRNAAGFVRTDDRCRVEGTSHVYAIGDLAELRGPEWRAKQGHLAEVMAEVAAADILAGLRGERAKAGYVERVDLLCLMDTGDGGAWVSRNARRARLIPLPFVGHWLKKAWAAHYRLGKLGGWPFVRWLFGELGRGARRLGPGRLAAPPRLGVRT
jgi:sulfide:quinone oxidoreductase